MSFTPDEKKSQLRASWLTGSTQFTQNPESDQEQEIVAVSSSSFSSSSSLEFPEGGFQAWSVAAGTAAALFCTMGYINSFGVYQTFYETNQLSNMTPSDISWIGSLQNFFIFFSGLFGGTLFDRYGASIIRPAAVAFVLSIMMTSLCKEYWHFMLAQGLLGGVSNGLIMSPSMAATSQYFSKKRGAAMGLAIAGSSVGAVVFPIALVKMLHGNGSQLGFGWAVRVCGFIVLGLLIWPCVAIKARLPPRKSNFLLLSTLKDPTYVIIITSTSLLFLGFFTPLFYLPSYAMQHGMGTDLASYLLSILNGASFAGRIIPGILADKVGRFNMLAAAGISSGILTLCWTLCTTNATMIIFAVLYGFCSGAIVSGFTVSLAFCADEPKNIGTYMGMGMAIASVAMLVGPPINGALLSHYQRFEEMAVFSGAMCLSGGFVVFAAKWTSGKGLLAAL